MPLNIDIRNAMQTALKQGAKDRVRTLRLLLSKLKEKSIATGEDLTDAESLKVLQTAAKQRREAIEQYLKGGREDLVRQEEIELKIIEEYLPSQLNEDDMRKIIVAVIEDMGAASMEEMGKVMGQRRVIARVLSESEDHPDVEVLYQRANAIDSRISIATVYRTVRLFEEANILERHEFGDGRARYEEMSESHHDHLINLQNGEVIEFSNDKIEDLQCQIAKKLGYELIEHRLELYAVPLKKKTKKK